MLSLGFIRCRKGEFLGKEGEDRALSMGVQRTSRGFGMDGLQKNEGSKLKLQGIGASKSAISSCNKVGPERKGCADASVSARGK